MSYSNRRKRARKQRKRSCRHKTHSGMNLTDDVGGLQRFKTRQGIGRANNSTSRYLQWRQARRTIAQALIDALGTHEDGAVLLYDRLEVPLPNFPIQGLTIRAGAILDDLTERNQGTAQKRWNSGREEEVFKTLLRRARQDRYFWKSTTS